MPNVEPLSVVLADGNELAAVLGNVDGHDVTSSMMSRQTRRWPHDLVEGESLSSQAHRSATSSGEGKRGGEAEAVNPRIFPVDEKLTRETFDAWFGDVYPIALRGVFVSKAETFARGKTRRRVSETAIMFDPKERSVHEARHDALARALELVYDTPLPDNPILGREYNSVEHLAHRFRKIANACGRSQRRAEAPELPTSAKGITSKVEAAIPDSSEPEPPMARFDSKYLAYEVACCPMCHGGKAPLKTRRCAACGVTIPEGADVELADDEGYQRVWERAAATVLRKAATEDRVFDSLADEHPYSAMLPLRIRTPRTSAMEAAWRAGAAAIRQRIADRYDTGAAHDRRAAIHTTNVMYGVDDGSYAASVTVTLGLGPDDTYAAAPPSKVRWKSSPALRRPELTDIEQLAYRVHRWRKVVGSEADRLGFVNYLLAKGVTPVGLHRRRPKRTLPAWPTPPLPSAKLPKAIQDYRLQAMLIGRHLLISLAIVLAEAKRTDEIPALDMPACGSDTFRAAAADGKHCLKQPPGPTAPYEARRRVEHLAALTYAYRNAAYSLDLEAFLGEVRRRYAYTW